jgi:hypothetical protein
MLHPAPQPKILSLTSYPGSDLLLLPSQTGEDTMELLLTLLNAIMCFVVVVFCYWGLNSGLHTCHTGAPPLKTLP